MRLGRWLRYSWLLLALWMLTAGGCKQNDTIVASNVHVLDPATEAMLIGATPDNQTYTFSSDASVIAGLHPGDIVVGEQNGGYAEWVLSVSQTPVGWVLTTRHAALTEIFQKAELHQTGTIQPVWTPSQAQAQSLAGNPGMSCQFNWPWDGDWDASGTAWAHHWSINEQLWSQQNTKDGATEQASLWFNAGYDIAINYALDLSISGFSLNQSSISLSGDMDAWAGLSANGTITYTSPVWTVYNPQLPPIKFKLGPVPITLNPSLSITAQVTATVAAKASVMASLGASYTLSESYTPGGSGDGWTPSHSLTYHPLTITPSISVNETASATLTATGAVKIWTFNLSGNLAPTGSFQWQWPAPAGQEAWQIQAALAGGVNIDGNVLGKSYTHTSSDTWGPWTLAQSNSGVIVTDISPANPALDIGGQLAFAAKTAGAGDQSVNWKASMGTIDNNGNFTAPSFPTTVTITATANADSTQSASTTVTVVNGPVITSFAASPSDVKQGTSAQLAAVFAGGTGTINQGVGPVQSGTSVSVIPAAATGGGAVTYTLTVTGPSGATATQTATVNVHAMSIDGTVQSNWTINPPAQWDSTVSGLVLNPASAGQAGSAYLTQQLTGSGPYTVWYEAEQDSSYQSNLPGGAAFAFVMNGALTPAFVGGAGEAAGVSQLPSSLALVTSTWSGSSCYLQSPLISWGGKSMVWVNPANFSSGCYTFDWTSQWAQIAAASMYGNWQPWKVAVSNGVATACYNGTCLPTNVALPSSYLAGFSAGTVAPGADGGTTPYQRHRIRNVYVSVP